MPTAKATVLFLSSNPVGTTPIDVDDEARVIDQTLLRAAKLRDAFALKLAPAARVEDFQTHLLEQRPVLVHFGGHGVRGGGVGARGLIGRPPGPAPLPGVLLVRDDQGNPVAVAPDALARLFQLLRGVRCVILNACFSEAQAKALEAHVDYVIGTTTAIPDAAALAFSKAFYEAIGAGETLKTAFELGKNAIERDGLGRADVVRDFHRAGVKPEEIRLAEIPLLAPVTAGSSTPWLPIFGVGAAVFPLVVILFSGHMASPMTRLLCYAAGALSALIVVVIAARDARPARRVLIVAVFLAYCFLLSVTRRRTVTLPDAALPRSDAVEKAISQAVGSAVYDMAPINHVTLEDVEAGSQRGGARVHVLVHVIWTKREASTGLERQYRGDVYYMGRYTPRPDGGLQVSEFDLVDYTISPSSNVLSYLIGFIEVDAMMTRQKQVIQSSIEHAAVKAFAQPHGVPAE